MAQSNAAHSPGVEYRVSYVDTRGRISSDGVEFIRQGGEHRTTFVGRYLSALGREGWSVAAIHHLSRPETAYYVFQRPLATEGEVHGDTQSEAAVE